MKRALGLVIGITIGMFGLTGPATAQTAGNQRFIVFGSGSGGQETTTVIAVGPITAVGTFEETDDEDVVRFRFPTGTITLDAPATEESDQFDERTCSGSFRFSGPFTVISGTGEFRNATGSGRFEGNGRFVGERGLDGCSEDEDSGFFFFLVNVTGNIRLSSASAA